MLEYICTFVICTFALFRFFIINFSEQKTPNQKSANQKSANFCEKHDRLIFDVLPDRIEESLQLQTYR